MGRDKRLPQADDAAMERMRRTGHELTPRQREVLQLVAKGHTNGEIAELLGISVDGVKWYVSELLMRLDVASREDAAEVWRSEQRLPTRFRGFVSGALSSPLAFLRAATALGRQGHFHRSPWRATTISKIRVIHIQPVHIRPVRLWDA